MLKLKMWLIVRVKWFWLIWCSLLLRKYQPSLKYIEAKAKARMLWNQHNQGYHPGIRFTPFQVINATMYQDALWEGDFLD